MIILTYIYIKSNGVSIPSSLSFSTKRLTRPLDNLNINIKKVYMILILDNDLVSGKVVIEGFNDIINIGNNNGKY
jgi:hypothetical protein